MWFGARDANVTSPLPEAVKKVDIYILDHLPRIQTAVGNYP